jgi:hypothetical protein
MEGLFDGSNVVAVTFTNAQVDPATRTIRLTVSGAGPSSLSNQGRELAAEPSAKIPGLHHDVRPNTPELRAARDGP